MAESESSRAGRFYSRPWRAVVPTLNSSSGGRDGSPTWPSPGVGSRRSEQEGDNGHAQGRVVPELLQVAAVLAFSPDGHLGEAHQGEEGHCGGNRGVRGSRLRAVGPTGPPGRTGPGSPGRHCVMMAKPIQDPTCGESHMRAGRGVLLRPRPPSGPFSRKGMATDLQCWSSQK